MKQKITPRLYRVSAISPHDSFSEIYTDREVANKAESDLWDDGGIAGSSIDYADESIDGAVVWKHLRKG